MQKGKKLAEPSQMPRLIKSKRGWGHETRHISARKPNARVFAFAEPAFCVAT
jgi:hypothetical protein